MSVSLRCPVTSGPRAGGSSELLEIRRDKQGGPSGQWTQWRDTGSGGEGISAALRRSSEQAHPSGAQLMGGQLPVPDVGQVCGLGRCVATGRVRLRWLSACWETLT